MVLDILGDGISRMVHGDTAEAPNRDLWMDEGQNEYMREEQMGVWMVAGWEAVGWRDDGLLSR